MTVAAIIAEYNPFHNGHSYHIDRTRAAGADYIVAIMSGAFVQRAQPAVLSKQARVKAALLGGADLVIELPVGGALSGAGDFALAGVTLADSLGCVDFLSFGGEAEKLDGIERAARLMSDGAVNEALRAGMKDGLSYPAARRAAAAMFDPAAATVLDWPNNILAVEYIRALDALSSPIRPLLCPRTGAPHDGEQTVDGFASASACRARLLAGEPLDGLVPPCSVQIIADEVSRGRAPVSYADMERAMLAHLRRLDECDFAAIPDVTEGLEKRIYSMARTALSVGGLADAIKSKRYTHSRIRRILLRAYLGLTREFDAIPHCIRILGLRRQAAPLVRRVRESATLPVVQHLADLPAGLDERAAAEVAAQVRLTDIWGAFAPTVISTGEDYTQFPVLV